MTRRFDLDENFDFKIIPNLNKKELSELSSEIKSLIIDQCSKFGGHLSSNLGITNLTIALFRSFDFDKDKIIFDIGHNSYPYKILTGRPLTNLRQSNGVDGFQKINESKYDVYDAGHSSTSLSAALGFAKVRDLKHENYNVIALVGDGGIANGLCFEALNNLVIANTKIIIIINDNEMSISPTNGGLSAILKGIRKNPLVKIIFKDANFEYLGPIDGDDFDQLKKAFEKAKVSKRSVILHVKTSKGEGYKYAEEDHTGEYHFVNPFDKETGKQKIDLGKNTVSFSKVFADLVSEDMKKDENTIAICPSTTVGAKLTNLFSELKDRTFDVGISEEHAAIFANAFGINGYHTYLFMYSTFLQRAYDEVLHDIARNNRHITLLIDRCGLIGHDGETHQGIYDDGFFYSIPNFVLAMPKDQDDAIRLFNYAKKYNHPMAIRYTPTYKNYDEIDAGKEIIDRNFEILQKGKDNNLALISIGPHLLSILSKLKDENVTIFNALFLKGYEEKSIQELLKFKKIYIYDPYGVETGFVANLTLDLIKHHYKGEILTRAIPLKFINKGNILEQEILLSVDVESLVNDVIKNCHGN